MNSQSNNTDQKRTSPPTIDSSPLTMDKNRESLKIKLMVRRSANQLVQQGILPDLKTSPAIHEQRQKLERAKTGDLLKAKIQQRPNREELERRHILESHESHIDPSLADKYRMLEKAILVDQLNSKISHRPGPLELIEKNILHANEPIERIVKEHLVEYKLLSVDESVVFEDDSQSSEGDAHPKSVLLASPNFEQSTSSSSSTNSTAILNGNVIKLNLAMPCTSATVIPIPKLTIKLPSNELTTNSIGQHTLTESFITTNPPPPPPLIINTKLKEMPSLELIKPTSFLPETKITIINNNHNIKSHISSFIQNNQKLGGKDKNRKKCKIKPSLKSKAIKFHEYKGPPNANKSNSLASLQASLNNKKVGENNYSLIMQQQCLLEYLEGIYKNPNSQKFDSDSVNSELLQSSNVGDKVSLLKHPDSDVIKKEDSKKAFVTIFPSKAPSSSSSSSSSSNVTQIKDALISDINQLSKLKVSELKAFLKKFSLPVSGPKPLLVERLKPFLPLKMGDQHQNGLLSDGLFEDKKEMKSMFDLKESPMQSPSAMLIDAENSFEGSNASSNTVGEDIVKEQQRKIEELQRKLQESQHELEQIKQIKHSDSFSSLSGVNLKSNAIDEEPPFFHIIPTNSTDLQNNLLYDQKYQITSPIFVVAEPSIVLAATEHATTINNLPLLLQQQTEDNGNSIESNHNNIIVDSVPPSSVMMINDEDDDEEENESRRDNLSENEVTSNDDTFQNKSLPFNIMQDDISDVLEILLKNEKWPESPLSQTRVRKRNEEQQQQPVLQSNVLSSTFNESLNEPMSPLLSNEISSGKVASSSSNYDKNCNSNFIDCPMDVDDNNTNMLIDSSSFSNFKPSLEIKKSPTHQNDNSPFINSHHKNDLDAGGSVGGGVKNSLIGNFDNNLFDTFKNNVSNNNNNNNLLNSNSVFYQNTNSNSEQNKDFKESDRNYMNNLNILNNFEIFSTASSMELAIPMDFEPYDIYQQDTFFNNINNLQNDRDGGFMNNGATYFDAENENDLFSEVDSFLESVVTTEKV